MKSIKQRKENQTEDQLDELKEQLKIAEERALIHEESSKQKSEQLNEIFTLFEQFTSNLASKKKLNLEEVDNFCGNFIKQQIKTINKVLNTDLKTLLDKDTKDISI